MFAIGVGVSCFGVASSLFKIAEDAILSVCHDVTTNWSMEFSMLRAPGFRLLQNVNSGESCQTVSTLVAHALWAFLSLSWGLLLEFGHCHILVLSGEDVTSRFSSPVFWLPQNATY